MLAMVCHFIQTTILLTLRLTYLAILFLCSQEAKWITGLIMPVDGGVSERSLYRHSYILGTNSDNHMCRQQQVRQTDQLSKLIH